MQENENFLRTILEKMAKELKKNPEADINPYIQILENDFAKTKS